MRFYVSTSKDNAPEAKRLTDALEDAGHEVTLDWTEHLEHKCSAETCGIDGRQGLILEEVAAAADAEWLFAITRMGRGAHVEYGVSLGAAHATGNRVQIVLVGPPEATADTQVIFYGHPAVRRALSVDEVLEWDLESLRAP